MGTRGCYGFRKNGIDKLTYNHYDSYPDGLGMKIVEFCKHTSLKKMNDIFDNIILVDESSIPTKEQIVECSKYLNLNVSNQSENDWYCLLREAQGNIFVYKNDLRYMIDNHEFIKDSVFCEYAYIINLDENCLEFWVGFQHKADNDNRYGTEQYNGYYPCKMIKKYDFNDIYNNVNIVRDMNNIMEGAE